MIKMFYMQLNNIVDFADPVAENRLYKIKSALNRSLPGRQAIKWRSRRAVFLFYQDKVATDLVEGPLLRVRRS